MQRQNQKFEFDLFSLPKKTCERLEIYVNQCILENNYAQNIDNENQQANSNFNADKSKEVD